VTGALYICRPDLVGFINGFSMRVMFIRGRVAWGDLPPKLKAEEHEYSRA
jgi:hypothetical protein